MIDSNGTAQVACLMTRAMACYARVEAMKAENQYRLGCGNGIAYGDEAFNEEAATLEHIAEGLSWWANA